MGRRGTIVIGAGAALAAWLVLHHRRAHHHGVAGGALVGNAGRYDSFSRLLLASLFDRVAAEVAAAAPPGARVLEAGCGPGHLSLRLAGHHGLDVTGIDVDPAMIDRARVNGSEAGSPVSFAVADVAALPYGDRSFDLVASTMSLHHWEDPAAGFAEIGRVLRPGGRALVWDLRPGLLPGHGHAPDLAAHLAGTPLRLVGSARWRWPWRLALLQRIELEHGGEPLA